MSRGSSFAPATEQQVLFAVPCVCGHVLHGQRLGKPQVLPCPACGEQVFVFPHRRFTAASSKAGLALALPAPSFRRLLLVALVTAAFCIVLVTVALKVFWQRKPDPEPNPSSAARISAATEAGRRALAEGSFHLAFEELSRAVKLAGTNPEALSVEERRSLNQLQRQSALLADLLPLSLEGLLQQAEDSASEAAWQARFKAEYQGKGRIFFDDVIRRLPDRSLTFRSAGMTRVNGIVARVIPGDLRLLDVLPLDLPQRWLIGARLAGFSREGGPDWIVRLERDSGVLFTDQSAVLAWQPDLKADPKLGDLLRRQAACLDTLQVPQPVLRP
jgi:hypothetical protein